MVSHRKRSQSLEMASNLPRKFFDANLRTRQCLKLKKRSKIEVNYQITPAQAAKMAGCSKPTAKKWLARVKPVE
jgi:hypothetical protein